MTIVAPTLSLDFVNSNQLDPRVTFTRASSATRVNAKGLIETVGANMPRFNYDPVDVPILGPELVVNGAFNTDTTGWATSAGGTIAVSSGQLVITQGTAGAYGQALQTPPLTLSKSYLLTYTIVSGSAIVQLGADYGGQAPGTYSKAFTHTGAYGSLLFAHNSGNAVGSTIVIDNVSVKEVTGYSAVAGRCRGLLIEEQRTNALSNGQVGATGWAVNGGTGTVGGFADPMGGMLATKITRAGTDIGYYIFTPVVAGTTYTDSIYFSQPTGIGKLRISCDNLGPANYSEVSLNTLAVSNTGSAIGSITPAGNGWYRFSSTFQAPASGSGSIICYVVGVDSSVIVFGAQREQGAFATSYIPTIGSAAARAPDVVDLNNPTWINHSEGAFVCSFNGGLDGTQNGYGRTLAFSLEKNSSISSSTGIATMGQTGVVQAWSGANTATAYGASGTDFWGIGGKYAASYGAFGFAISASGSPVGKTTADFRNGRPAFVKLTLGGNVNSASNMLNGHVRSFQFLPVAPTDTELRELSK